MCKKNLDWSLGFDGETFRMRKELNGASIMVYLIYKKGDKCFYRLNPITRSGYIASKPLLIRDLSNDISLENAIDLMENRIAKTNIRFNYDNHDIVVDWNGHERSITIDLDDSSPAPVDKFTVLYDETLDFVELHLSPWGMKPEFCIVNGLYTKGIDYKKKE